MFIQCFIHQHPSANIKQSFAINGKKNPVLGDAKKLNIVAGEVRMQYLFEHEHLDFSRH